MAKGVKGGGKGSSNKTSQSEVCLCEHPFQCSCGKRPDRPSKGHKWDAQLKQWGGKGHKQKGAGGVGNAYKGTELDTKAKTTEVGGTVLQPWQSLPSTLLKDVCSKESRPLPKFQRLEENSNKKYIKYKCTVKDSKKNGKIENDLIFIPAGKGALNEEQAMEESALLALLQLTPNLPHERRLPEPYKSTWLHALGESAKKDQGVNLKKLAALISKETTPEINPTAEPNKASVNTSLTQGLTFVSKAERDKHYAKERSQIQEVQRRNEALQRANAPHPCFMSASIRRTIERLLRGDSRGLEERDEDENEPLKDLSPEQSVILEKIVSQGFTSRQAHRAVLENASTDNNVDCYEICLQWLCIHLNEDELPEGFDPRGRTLDVIATSSQASSTVNLFNNKYGLSTMEAQSVESQLSAPVDGWKVACTLWNLVSNNINIDPLVNSQECTTPDCQLWSEEAETLQAIFSPEECIIEQQSSNTKVSLTLTNCHTNDGTVLAYLQTPNVNPQLVIYITDTYPSSPCMAFLESVQHVSASSNHSVAWLMLREFASFIHTLPLGEPMIYQIYTHAVSLLSLNLDTLISNGANEIKQAEKNSNLVVESNSIPVQLPTKPPPPPKRRPRDTLRASFWTMPPSDMKQPTSSPKVPISIQRQRQQLPASKSKEQFIQLISDNPVLLITGETGCGKTTQIPQYLLDDPCNKIVVAQPRRLAATGVATRVAQERGETIGNSVGFVVRGDVQCSVTSTRLLFCTTGVLLRQLQSENPLDCLTHIVVDEVHERHLDTDVLLGLLKKFLPTNPHLKIVLMSATMDADHMAAYWSTDLRPTPRMHIPGFTHPVRDFTLEDVLKLTGYIPRKHNKSLKSPVSSEHPTEVIDLESRRSILEKHMNDLLGRMDPNQIPYDLLAVLLQTLLNEQDEDNGSILVFLPGAPEIQTATNIIRRLIPSSASYTLLPLHGGLQSKEQNLVFSSAPSRKIILATNVAETSITIPDCTCVIDTCREKQASYDPVNRMPLLVEQFATLDSLKQRRGRAGRVRPGTCYKLINKSTLNSLQPHGTPEILRCALDQTLLQVLFLDVEDGTGSFLKTLPTPPSQTAIDSALHSLHSLGAINVQPVCLTPLGVHLSGIPAPPTVAKLMVMGAILGCRTAALSIAAGMTLGKSPFLKVSIARSNHKRHNADDNNDDVSQEDIHKQKQEAVNQAILQERAKLLKVVGNSDHAMLAAVYLAWDSSTDKRRYCESLGLSVGGMHEMKTLFKQYDSAVKSLGFVHDMTNFSWRVVRACVVAALAPRQLVRVHRPTAKYAETGQGTVAKVVEAKQVRFYVRSADVNVEATTTTAHTQPNSPDQKLIAKYHNIMEEQVFLHPSSNCFSTGSFSCPWLVYHELVRTTKPYMRDATEASSYALLLFGGSLKVLASQGLIVVDEYIRLAASPRVGALIGGLRLQIDLLMESKVANPSLDISKSQLMSTIIKLIVSDGLGKIEQS